MNPGSPFDRIALPPLASLAGLASGKGRGARLFILIYHQVLEGPDPMRPGEVDEAAFTWQMALLARHFRVLPLAEGVRRLREGTLPRRAVAITFDDGYRNNYSRALPILERFGLPATFFVATGFLDGGRMWNDTVIETLRRTRREEVALPEYGLPTLRLDSMGSRCRAAHQIIDAIKHLPFDERAARVETIARLADDLPDDLMMTSDQVRDLARRGMEVGGHTVNHPILSRLDDDAARREIHEGKEHLADLIRKPVQLFAYPNGKPGRDYTERDVGLVREAGFEAAVSTTPGASCRQDDVFQLRRFTPWDPSPWRFVARMAQYYRMAPAA